MPAQGYFSRHGMLIGLLVGGIAVVAAAQTAHASLAPTSSAFSCDQSPLLVTNVSLWAGGRALPRREVLIARGRIAAIGLAGRLSRKKGVRHLDGNGALMLPGLIDSHTHYVLPAPAPTLTGDQQKQELAMTGRAALSSGVTTGRIHLMPLDQTRELRAQADDLCFPAPRFEFGGPGLFGDSPGLDGDIGWGFSDRSRAIEKLRLLRYAGAKWLAVHDADKVPRAEFAAIAGEARRLGLRLMASGQNRAEIDAALQAGAQSFEYVMAGKEDHYDSDLLAKVRRSPRPVYFSIPVGYYRWISLYRSDPAALDNPALYAFIPQGIADQVRTAQKRQINDPSTPRRDPRIVAARFRQLFDAGMKLVVSTDSGSPAQLHRNAYWNELGEWRRLGVPVPGIIEAATARPAAMLGRTDIGKLTVGARADFLLYQDDLSRGEFDVGKVRTVAKGGVLFVNEGRWIGP